MSKEITVITKASNPLVEKARNLKITSPKQMTEATEILSKLNKYLKSVVAYREKKTKPLNEALKVIRAETKPLETDLSDLITSLRRGMTDYQTEQNRIAEEAKDKISARVGDGRGHLKAETAADRIAEVDTPETAISTQAGAVKFRKVEKFELEDITKVPHEYLITNDSMIRTAMKEGTKIPGIRYFTEDIPVNIV